MAGEACAAGTALLLAVAGEVGVPQGVAVFGEGVVALAVAEDVEDRWHYDGDEDALLSSPGMSGLYPENWL